MSTDYSRMPYLPPSRIERRDYVVPWNRLDPSLVGCTPKIEADGEASFCELHGEEFPWPCSAVE